MVTSFENGLVRLGVTWLTHLPDLTPLDVFLWGYMKNIAYVPPLATSLLELTTCKRAALASHTISNALWTMFLLGNSKILLTTLDQSIQLHLVFLLPLLAYGQCCPKIIQILCINLYMTDL